MRKNAGFTLVEMIVATTIFAAGSLYVYSTFSGVTQSSRSATLEIDLGSHNKQALTRLYNEMQATSLTPQDTDGLDSTDPVAVFELSADMASPAPRSKALVVNRGGMGGAKTGEGGDLDVGGGRQQAREREIARSTRIRFRKVIGYQFNAGAGTIVPEWSNWISYFVNANHQLMRQVDGRTGRVVAHHVDALEAIARPDGTVVVTLITAKRHPTRPGFKRYANSVTIHPKN